MMSEEKKRVLDLFARGRKLYKLMQFEEARKYFAHALQVKPDYVLSKVYLARCKYYIEPPPLEDWDGVFVMTSK